MPVDQVPTRVALLGTADAGAPPDAGTDAGTDAAGTDDDDEVEVDDLLAQPLADTRAAVNRITITTVRGARPTDALSLRTKFLNSLRMPHFGIRNHSVDVRPADIASMRWSQGSNKVVERTENQPSVIDVCFACPFRW